ncbi:MAG: alpha/beta fold hydrolase [Candidatus Lokiarchaeota archaeon]|nr:alpha/beta fold hydrolase [Candidatus Lokiarchaeota archaeon]
MNPKTLRRLVFSVALILLVSGTTLAWAVQNNFGGVVVTEVDFMAEDGSLIHSTLQKPREADASNPLPGVLIIHGALQNKEWVMGFGIELSRRGFVALTIDVNGHGNSDAGSGSGEAGLDYLSDLDFVDSGSLGIIGHSMGSFIAGRVLNETSQQVGALVIVGGSVFEWYNTTRPNNLLVTVGSFDSLFRQASDRSSLTKCFDTDTIEPGVTYGSHDDGSARKLVIANTNHLFETVDPVIIEESVDWLGRSLEPDTYNTEFLPKENLIYPFWLVGGLMGITGLIISIIPLAEFITEHPFFSSLNDRQAVETSENLPLYKGVVYGTIGLVSFFPLLAVGTVLETTVDFPQRYALPVLSWMLGTTLLLLVVVRMLDRESLGWMSKESLKSISKERLIRVFLLVLVLVSWLYACTLVVDLGLALDFRCFLPGLNDFTVSRALLWPIYSLAFLPYFFVESKWLLRMKGEAEDVKGYIRWTVKGVIAKVLPYFVVISIQYGVGLATGVPIVPGLIGFSFLFFYAFAPWFMVAVILSIWTYRATGDELVGALLNSLLFAWMVATVLSFS